MFVCITGVLMKIDCIWKWKKKVFWSFKASNLIWTDNTDLQERKKILTFEYYLTYVNNLDFSFVFLRVCVPLRSACHLDSLKLFFNIHCPKFWSTGTRIFYHAIKQLRFLFRIAFIGFIYKNHRVSKGKGCTSIIESSS